MGRQGQGRGRTRQERGNPRTNNNKIKNKNKYSSDNTQLHPKKIEDVVFMVGGNDKASYFNAHLNVVIDYVRQNKSEYGETRNIVADAIKNGVLTGAIEPKVTDTQYKPTSVKSIDPDAYEWEAAAVRSEYNEDRKKYKKDQLEISNSLRSITTLMWEKCSTKLRAKMEDNESVEDLKKDALEMKKKIKLYATGHTANNYPLMNAIVSMSMFLSMKQSDNETLDEWVERVKAMAAKVREEWGAMVVPEAILATETGYDKDMNAAARESFSKTLWTRFVVMVAIKGTNHSKYGSWKKNYACIGQRIGTRILQISWITKSSWSHAIRIQKRKNKNIIRLKRELLW